MKQPKIVSIGGGTGSFTLLQQFKIWTPNITAIVNMSDDGGSSGQLRDELGVLPPGDVRQCLVALSNHPDARELFDYRFGGDGKLASHSAGNIILSALELQTGSFTKAIKIASDFLKITGKVVPVTEDSHKLVLVDGDKVVDGEFKISKHAIKHKGARLHLEPEAVINKEANSAIEQADMVIIAPGNFYGSLLPALSVKGMAEALNSTKAKVVMIANLVNKPQQALNWHVVDYVLEMESYIGKNTIDIVLFNTELPSERLLKYYAEDKEFPVLINPKRFSEISARSIGAKLVASNMLKQNPNDNFIRRTLIRHDASEVTRQLAKLIESKAHTI